MTNPTVRPSLDRIEQGIEEIKKELSRIDSPNEEKPVKGILKRIIYDDGTIREFND